MLIVKGATTLQLHFAKPHEHKNTCSSAMVTCDMPGSKGSILWSSCISAMVTCDMLVLKGNILWSSCISAMVTCDMHVSKANIMCSSCIIQTDNHLCPCLLFLKEIGCWRFGENNGPDLGNGGRKVVFKSKICEISPPKNKSLPICLRSSVNPSQFKSSSY